jgi:hypothetical protein
VLRLAVPLIVLTALLAACDNGSSSAPSTRTATTTGPEHKLVLVEWPAAAKRFLRQTIERQGGAVQSINCAAPAESTSCTVSWTDAHGYACDTAWPLKLTAQGVRTAKELPVICTLNS